MYSDMFRRRPRWDAADRRESRSLQSGPILQPGILVALGVVLGLRPWGCRQWRLALRTDAVNASVVPAVVAAANFVADGRDVGEHSAGVASWTLLRSL
jgi:hypothetical protein